MSVRTLTLLAGCCLAVLVTMHAPQATAQGNPVVVIETSLGNITAELDQANAPLSVANFLEYVEIGHYSGTVFPRVADSPLTCSRNRSTRRSRTKRGTVC